MVVMAGTARGGKIEESCSPLGTTFRFYQDITDHTYDLEYQFKRGWLLGQGAFGVVRSVHFGLQNIARAAVKEIENSPNSVPELNALIFFSARGLGNRFYGCQYTAKKLYLVQELLFKDLANDHMLLLFRQKPNSYFVERMLDILDSLLLLEETRMMHGDIKEENLMTDKDFTVFKVIDFGLSQSVKERLKPQGTPVYMSPGKWAVQLGMPSHRDDLYSLGVLAGVLNNDNGFSSIYKDYTKDSNGADPPKGCFVEFLTQHCQDLIKNNVIRLLSRANFGAFKLSGSARQEDTVNFTTLIGMMIEYHGYPFSLAQTKSILQRHAKEYKELESGVTEEFDMRRSRLMTSTTKKRFGKLEPDIPYDPKRVFARVHPDDMPNYLLKLEVAEKLDKKLETEKQKEFDARMALLEAHEDAARLEVQSKTSTSTHDDPKGKHLAKMLRQSISVIGQRHIQYKKAMEELREVATYMHHYHKKSQVQKEVVQLVAKEASEVKFQRQRSMEPKRGKMFSSQDGMGVRREEEESTEEQDSVLESLKAAGKDFDKIFGKAKHLINKLQKSGTELPDEIRPTQVQTVQGATKAGDVQREERPSHPFLGEMFPEFYVSPGGTMDSDKDLIVADEFHKNSPNRTFMPFIPYYYNFLPLKSFLKGPLRQPATTPLKTESEESQSKTPFLEHFWEDLSKKTGESSESSILTAADRSSQEEVLPSTDAITRLFGENGLPKRVLHL